jgi:hypothetical protein
MSTQDRQRKHALGGPLHLDLIYGDQIAAEAMAYYSSSKMTADERLQAAAGLAARLAVQKTWQLAEAIARKEAEDHETIYPTASSDEQRDRIAARARTAARVADSIRDRLIAGYPPAACPIRS